VGDQHVVEGHLTEFVDDDQRVGKLWLTHQMVEQGGLPAAQKTGQ
jgi:hypothetical protein